MRHADAVATLLRVQGWHSEGDRSQCTFLNCLGLEPSLSACMAVF